MPICIECQNQTNRHKLYCSQSTATQRREWEEEQLDKKALRKHLQESLDSVSPATRYVIYNYPEKDLPDGND